MIRFKEIFFSNLVGTLLFDTRDREIGRVRDVAIHLGELFPRVSGIYYQDAKKGKKLFIPIENVGYVSREMIRMVCPESEIKRRALTKEELLLGKGLLDKQIVDTNDYKVVRVNDLKLTKVGSDIRLVAADIGELGILRRLKMEWLIQGTMMFFGKKLNEKLLPWNLVQPFQSELAKVQLNISHAKLAKLHPSDIAHVVTQLPPEEQEAVFQSLNIMVASEVLHELGSEIQIGIMERLEVRRGAELLENMPPDEAVDVLNKLPAERRRALLRLMRRKVAEQLAMLMRHSADTAGGLMTTEFIALPQNLTVEQTVARLREMAPDAETIYYLYVVDGVGRLVGVLSLRRLIVSAPDKPISEIMATKVLTVEAGKHQREVAELFSKYNLLAMPVVDKEGKLLGIITVDDILDIFLPPAAKKRGSRLG